MTTARNFLHSSISKVSDYLLRRQCNVSDKYFGQSKTGQRKQAQMVKDVAHQHPAIADISLLPPQNMIKF